MLKPSELSKKELVESNKRYLKLEKENVDLKTRFEECQKANRKLRQKNESLIKETGVLQLSNQQLQKENQEMSKTHKQLQDTNRKLEAKVNSGLRGFLSKHETAMNKLKERNQFLENELVRLTDISHSQAREINVLNDVLDTNLKDSKLEEKLLYEVSSLREDNKVLRETNEQQAQLILELQTTSEDAIHKRDFFEEQVKHYEATLRELSGKLNQIEMANSNIQRQCSDLEQEKGNLLEEIGRKATDLDNIQQLYRELTQNYNYLQQIEHELRHKSTMVDHELRQKVIMLSSENASVSQQLDEFSKMNFESQKLIAENAHEIARLTDLIDRLTKRNQELQEKVSRFEGEKQMDLKRLQDRITEREEDLSELKHARRRKEHEYEEAAKELSEERVVRKRMETQVDELDRKIARLEESKQLMQKTLLDQLNKERERIKEFELKMKQLNDEILQKEKENSRMHILIRAQKRSKENSAIKKAKQMKDELDSVGSVSSRGSRTPDSVSSSPTFQIEQQPSYQYYVPPQPSYRSPPTQQQPPLQQQLQQQPSPTLSPTLVTPMMPSHQFVSPQFTGVNTAAKRISNDKYRSSDGQPLDLFALAYASPANLEHDQNGHDIYGVTGLPHHQQYQHDGFQIGGLHSTTTARSPSEYENL